MVGSMGGDFWRKVEESRRIGLTAEEFSRIETLEATIAHLEDEIENYSKEIKQIMKEAESRVGCIKNKTVLSKKN